MYNVPIVSNELVYLCWAKTWAQVHDLLEEQDEKSKEINKAELIRRQVIFIV